MAAAARRRVAAERELYGGSALYADAESLAARFDGAAAFEAALAAPGLSVICEVKKASPSRGVISPDFPYLEIARAYERAGASAISVLTEPEYFLGRDAVLREIAETVKIPLLRKDFVVDEYMVYRAKTLGASAVLLICAILGDGALRDYIALCKTLRLAALVEAHDAREVQIALAAGARILGVNNRDLRTFAVDTDNAARLRDAVPPGVLFVSESGIASPADARATKDMRADAVLVGEALMRAADKRAFLEGLRNA
ncbi:MAG: indole-3-glycerol phosphate synthase TrpC [Oscillospiraceae bacterium]|nr:indole-3-glycerol phosphate synthase TrpC [Oscillospiraceae bacterium]